MNTIGKNRKKLNLSVTDLSKELSTSPSMIESWELGINMPELDQLIKMVEIFGKDADEILFGEVIDKLNITELSKDQRMIIHNLYDLFIHENEVLKNDSR